MPIVPYAVPYCVVGNTTRAFSTNLRRFQELVSARKELMIQASYTVHVSGVVTHGRKKKRGVP